MSNEMTKNFLYCGGPNLTIIVTKFGTRENGNSEVGCCTFWDDSIQTLSSFSKLHGPPINSPKNRSFFNSNLMGQAIRLEKDVNKKKN